jgi:hypothetical protein
MVDADKEPPSSNSCSNAPLFFIGRDSRGHWVVQDQQHLCGGLFVGRAEALRFALFENGHRPQAVIMVPDVLELDLTGRAPNPAHMPIPANSPRQLQVA